MTEEEIRPIAEDYVEEYCHCPDGEYTDGSLVCAGIGTALIVSKQLEKRIANLEKENAELKEKLNFSTQYYQGEKAKEQLNKAKQIIQEFLELNYSEFTKTNAVFLHADKFLKES